MKSYKTTFAGALAALGTYLAGLENADPAWLSTCGEILVGVGAFLIGLWARDNDKTSEAAGAAK